MINKIKIGFLMILLSFVFGAGSALAADLNFPVDTNVIINANTYVIVAGSAATQPLTVSGTTLLVTGAAPSFTLTSANGFTLANNGGLVPTCVGAVSQIVVPTGITVTITPTSVVVCPVSGGGGGGSSGGGGGGRVAPPASIPPGQFSIAGCENRTFGFNTLTGESCATNTVVVPVVIVGCGNSNLGFSPVTGQSCANNFVTNNPASPVSGVIYDFGNVTLRNGSSGAAVMELQRFLNRFLVLTLVIDGKFGPKTAAAAKRWQVNNGLVADGFVGPKTKANMNAWAATH